MPKASDTSDVISQKSQEGKRTRCCQEKGWKLEGVNFHWTVDYQAAGKAEDKG